MAQEPQIGIRETEGGAGAPPLDPSGIAPALASLEAERRLDPGREQDELFASSPLFASSAALRPVRGRGRPPGAQNKTTDEWRAYFLRSYRSPMFALGDLVASDPIALLEAIRKADGDDGRAVSLLDVLNLQRACASDLMAYLHRKQPIAIDGGEDKQMPLIAQFVLDAGTAMQIWGGGAQSVEAEAESAFVVQSDEGEVAAAKSQHPGEGPSSD